MGNHTGGMEPAIGVPSLSNNENIFDIIEFLPDATFVIDLNKKVIAWNQAAEKLTGVKKAEILGKGDFAYALPFYGMRRPLLIDLVFHPHLKLDAQYYYIKRRKHFLYAEGYTPMLDGKKASYFSAVAAPLFDKEGQIVGAIESIRNITEQKLAEIALKESEERYHWIVETAAEGIWTMNENSFTTFVNTRMAAMLGYNVSEMAGRNVQDFMFAEDLQDHGGKIEIRRKGGAEQDERRFSRRDGTEFWALVSATPLVEHGKFAGVFAMFTDITARKQAEEAMRESEERFRSTFEQAAVGIAHIDLPGHFLRVNQRYCDICGYTADEMLQKTFQEITCPEDLNYDLEQARRLVESEIQTSTHEKRYIRKDGTMTWVNLTVSLARGPAGTALYFIAVIEDINKRKEAEKALLQSEEKYRSIFENAVEGIFQSTADGRLISINPAMARMHGYDSPTEMTDKIYDIGNQLFAKPQDWESFRRLIAAQELIMNFETQSLHKSGSRIWILINARAARNNKGRILCFEGTVEDITQRKEGEAALRRYELLSENTREVILFVNREGEILEGNQAAVLAYGYDRETLLSLSIFDLRAPHLREGLKNDLQDAYGEGLITETEHIRKDRTVFPVEVSARPVDLGGERFVLSIVRDINERKRAENDVKQAMGRLRKATGGIIDVIVNAVELRDPYTSGHQRRVANLARTIATEMKLLPEQIDGIRMAGVIHDVGKISIPAEILSMPRKLTTIEFEMIKTHAETGYQILKDIHFPWPLADIVRQHHERFDGSGYPLGLKGDEILLEARIIACADVVEAIASHRPYRPSVGIDAAFREIEENRGILYDPNVVDACLRLFREKGFQLT